ITQEEYNQAMSVDRKTLIKPGETKTTDITNYFTDYVLKQVEQDLMDKYGWSKKIAQNKIFYGGIQIYSTINVGYQKIMEDAYKNFVEILFGNTNNMRAPIILDTTSDAYANLVDSNGNFIYLAKDNLIVQNSDDIYLAPGEWRYDENGNLCIKSKKLKAYNSNIDVQDYYTIDEKKTLVTHIVGSLPIAKDDFWVENGEIVISSKAIVSNDSLFKNKDDYLHIDGNQVYRNKKGVPQPQSAMIIIDYHTGHILAMIGGRDVDGNRFLNRATDSHRQPGSTIKPVSVYLPALENGYTAASPIDDVPIVVNGKIWPNNWYLGFRGIHSLRYAVEQSINVSAVKVLNSMGPNKVVPYLERMGIIDTEHPDRDSFVSASENSEVNDENASSLALGGMTNGLSPLALTAAFGTIANDGVYLKPTSYTKVIDNDGTTLLEYTENPVQAAKPQTAYVMKDILRTVVTRGLGTRAQIPGQVVAGKTGTTQYTADLWFSGFTDYYAASTWIGSDSPKITMKQNSMIAAQLFQYVMSQVHEGLPSVTQFKEPEGIVRASVCTMSGKSPNEFCAGDPRGTVITEIFVKGTEPTEACDAHVEVEICTESNMLANEFCPEETREKVVRVQTTPPYDPESHGGVIPSDMQYRVPSKTCDIHNESNTGESEIIDILNPGGDDEFDINDFLNNNNNGENENNTDTPDTNHESQDENEDQKEPPGTIDLLQ
ncbi:MAG: penicillin-binding transpeptidase domain-containing protein, partial [Ezakiella massiliensis]